MNVSVTPVDKIDVEELIKDFKVHNVDQFASYLKEDLSLRSEDKSKGISKVTFTKYYELPGIISERLFAVFDKNKNEYIDSAEFNEGMVTLFVESYEKMLKFIFNFYDFDKDGTITKEDIRVVLSYIPLNTKQKADKLRYEKEDYKDRVESQDELHSLLEKCFTGIEKMDFNHFSETVEKVSSEIFLYILIFIMEKRPFSKKTLQEFEFHARKHSNSLGGSSHLKVNNLLTPNKLIASPSLTSKFSPSVTISKSPTMTKRMSEVQTNDSASILNKYSKNTTETSKQTLNKYVSGKNEEESKEELHVKQPVKKNRINLKNIEDLSQNKKVIKEQEKYALK